MNARGRVLHSSPFALKFSNSFIAAMKKEPRMTEEQVNKERIQLIEEQKNEQMVAKHKAALAARSSSQRKSNLNGIRSIFSTQQNSRFETPPPTPPRTSPLETEFIVPGLSPIAKGGYNSQKYKKPKKATILPKKPKKATILPKKPKNATILPKKPKKATILPKKPKKVKAKK